MTLMRREAALVSRGFDPDDFYVLREKKKQKGIPLSKVIRVLLEGNPGGLTCDEIEHILNRSHQTISSRLNEMVGLKLIKDSKVRRPTRFGRQARVYVVR